MEILLQSWGTITVYHTLKCLHICSSVLWNRNRAVGFWICIYLCLRFRSGSLFCRSLLGNTALAQVMQVVKKLPANAGGKSKRHRFDPRIGKNTEEGMATHSSILAWRIPGTEEPGRLWSIGLKRVGHN